MIVDKLPEIATNVSKPLENTKEMVFVSSDGSGPSQLTGDITKMMAQIPATVHGLTGVVCLPVSSSLRLIFSLFDISVCVLLTVNVVCMHMLVSIPRLHAFSLFVSLRPSPSDSLHCENTYKTKTSQWPSAYASRVREHCTDAHNTLSLARLPTRMLTHRTSGR